MRCTEAKTVHGEPVEPRTALRQGQGERNRRAFIAIVY